MNVPRDYNPELFVLLDCSPERWSKREFADILHKFMKSKGAFQIHGDHYVIPQEMRPILPSKYDNMDIIPYEISWWWDFVTDVYKKWVVRQ